jgi:hypothetical protein
MLDPHELRFNEANYTTHGRLHPAASQQPEKSRHHR